MTLVPVVIRHIWFVDRCSKIFKKVASIIFSH